MSDTKLDTRSLSAEEEAILDACFRGNIHDLGSAIVCYGRALFGQGASEAADPMASWGVWRCECCAAVANPADSAFRWNGDCWQHHHAEAQTHFDCQFFGPCPRQRPEPAQPEPKPEPAATDVFATDRAIGVQAMNAEDVPAATEMPEAVKNAWKALRKENYETFALALESWWRTHAAQPVKAPRPKLEKVREFINGVSNAWLNSEGKAKKLQALAELDAYESGGKGVEG